ncbi:MAG: arginine--tRNA ligase, partial [Treponema sp.]|nr:arginine--tRNA ligase [Treponema sp.]
MADVKTQFKSLIADAVNEIIKEKNLGSEKVEAEKIVVQPSPNPEMGDIGSPMFMFAKSLRIAPPQIAQEVVAKITGKAAGLGEVLAVGPYVNLKMDKKGAVKSILTKIETEGEDFGTLGNDGKPHLAGSKIMIEFSSPNTNKPLHLGHMRNDALGESVSRILKKAGAEVCKVDLINNRGIHICKSML